MNLLIGNYLFQHRRFHLRPMVSPTYYNVHKYLQEQGWKSTRFNCLADFGEDNFQFDVSAAEQLEFKHLLAQSVAEYCPSVMPKTYVINDNNWSVVLNELADTYYLRTNQGLVQDESLVWILKPSMLNNGKHIKIFQSLNEIERHFISAKRLGGEHVLQQYIGRPHLLKGHKYSIRMFVVLTNFAGVYLYPKGYLNVSLSPYEPKNFVNLNAHLTNEHLSDIEPNTVQIPTDYLEHFPALYPQIKSITEAIIDANQSKNPQAYACPNKPKLALFGFDFMVDVTGKVWFLEANHGPCFPTSDDHPLQKYVYGDFWQALIEDFINPIGLGQLQKDFSVQHFDLIV